MTVRTESPAPINLHVLDHITKTTATLDSWLVDWHDHLGWAPPSYRTDPMAEAASALRANLPWAAEHHPAIADFMNEVTDLHRTATGLLDPAARPRRIGTCPTALDDSEPCGAPLRYVPGSAAITCGWCGAVWDPLDLAALVQATSPE
ncbi:hypothetical protein MOV08_21140 [Streptomyces yunnanensis]|uniref:Uncharacterized protein n=1 Tax=Streptomyces yunnanensis TaxID=156453 RepID=A0ABY8A987_9ACTN|nr:hypothetical protein [Streptomyces yunnanensis]WEB41528.1 hypothetical protein MOV08_21140 [Streptomyces yunnanensis]